MSKERGRTVFRRPDGMWVNKRNDSQEHDRVLRTQREAVEEARRNLMTEGGGVLTIVGEGPGDTDISPGKDPFPSRDTKP